MIRRATSRSGISKPDTWPKARSTWLTLPSYGKYDTFLAWVPELAVVALRRFTVGGVSGFGCVVTTKPMSFSIGTNRRAKLTASRNKHNALQANRVPGVLASIFGVVFSATRPKVTDSVIRSICIYMINFFWGLAAVIHLPYYSMGKIEVVSYFDGNVTCGLWGARYLPRIPSVCCRHNLCSGSRQSVGKMRKWSFSPDQLSRVPVIGKALSQVGSVWQHSHFGTYFHNYPHISLFNIYATTG